MHTSPLAQASTYGALTVPFSFVSLSADPHPDSLFTPSFLPNNTAYSTTTAGQTPLHEACWSSHPHIVRLLLASGITSCSALCHLFVAFQHLHIRNSGADVSAIEAKDGDSALHWAVYKGQQEIVHMLLEVRTSQACNAPCDSYLFCDNRLARR